MRYSGDVNIVNMSDYTFFSCDMKLNACVLCKFVLIFVDRSFEFQLYVWCTKHEIYTKSKFQSITNLIFHIRTHDSWQREKHYNTNVQTSSANYILQQNAPQEMFAYTYRHRASVLIHVLSLPGNLYNNNNIKYTYM